MGVVFAVPFPGEMVGGHRLQQEEARDFEAPLVLKCSGCQK